MKTSHLFMECGKTCAVIFLSLVLMTAGFVLTLMGWFAPPMNNFVNNVRMGGPIALLIGFLLMLLSCMLCAIDQGKCCHQCHRDSQSHRNNYRSTETLLISNNHSITMGDKTHVTPSVAQQKGYHERDTVVNIHNKTNSSYQTYTTIRSPLPEMPPQHTVDILSYQQDRLSEENNFSNFQCKVHAHKLNTNTSHDKLLRKGYQSRNLHNTQRGQHKLPQSHPDILPVNNKSLDRHLKHKRNFSQNCMTQTHGKLKYHPDTVHHSSNGSAVCNKWESLVDTASECTAQNDFLWDHGELLHHK